MEEYDMSEDVKNAEDVSIDEQASVESEEQLKILNTFLDHPFLLIHLFNSSLSPIWS